MIGGGDQLTDGRLRVARAALHGAADHGRRHQVAQAVAAQHQRAIGFEGNALNLNEIRVSGRMLLGAHVAENLIPARVTHGLQLVQLARFLALADGRMVVGDFADGAAANLVEARIAHVAHHRGAVLQQDQREHAGHAFPLRIGTGGAQDFVVGHGDGFADALLGRAGLPLQARAHAPDGDLRGLFTGGLPADAVHHEKDAAVRVDVKRIFVVPAHQPRIARRRAPHIGLNHSMSFGIRETARPPGRSEPAPEQAPPGCGRASRRPRIPRWKAPSGR